METFICDHCNKLFYNAAGPTDCPYCKHSYVTWITYPARSKKEVAELIKRADKKLH